MNDELIERIAKAEALFDTGEPSLWQWWNETQRDRYRKRAAVALTALGGVREQWSVVWPEQLPRSAFRSQGFGSLDALIALYPYYETTGGTIQRRYVITTEWFPAPANETGTP